MASLGFVRRSKHLLACKFLHRLQRLRHHLPLAVPTAVRPLMRLRGRKQYTPFQLGERKMNGPDVETRHLA